MRAIHLTVTAFGPYRDQQSVNFQELGDESIFLITGPTGAGKTTVFDAICYALYGKASGSDRDQDSLRSHFAGINLPTEVSFTFSLKGKIYLVTRSPKQQKRKARGEGYTEEPAKAELYEVTKEKNVLLSAKIKDVNDTLEEKLGLDYEQFRKMIMIPQGEFRRLISENSKEREEILQRIFHTHFYERFTEELKKQSKELRDAIKQIEWQMEQEAGKIEWQITNPEPADTPQLLIQKLEQEIESDKKQQQQLQEESAKGKALLEKAQEAFYAGRQLAEKFLEKQQLENEEKQMQQQEQDIHIQQKNLQLAEQAAKVVPVEQQVNNRKAEWERQTARVKSQKEKVESLSTHYKKVKEQYEEKALQDKERERAKQEVDSHKKQLEKLYLHANMASESIKIKQQQQQAQSKIEKGKLEINQMQSQLEETEAQLNGQSESMKAFYDAEAALKEARERASNLERLVVENQKLKAMRKQFQQVHKDYSVKQQNLADLKQAVQKLEEEQRNNHAIFLAKHLHDGESCPVCGSKEHPQKAAGNQTDISEGKLTELTTKLSDEEQAFTKWQDHYIKIKADGQAQRRVVEQIYEAFEQTLGEFEEQKVAAYLEKWQQAVQQNEKKKKEAESQLHSMQQASKQREQLQTSIKNKNKELEDVKLAAEKITESWIKNQTQLEQLKQELQNPQMTPDEAETALKQKENHYQQQVEEWEKIKQQYQEIKEGVQQASTVLEQIEGFAAETEAIYKAEQLKFNEAVKENGFASIDEYQQAKLPETTVSELRRKIEQFTQRRTTLKERLKTLNEQLKQQNQPDLQELAASVQSREKEIEEITELLQERALKMKHHSKICTDLTALLEEHETLAKKYYDIGELADLARGENHLKLSFERYVLSSFLDEILLQANIRLDQMTEHRYHLVRSDQVAKRGAQSGLDLEVLDHHTGQQRSVKTLSGGEGFKAALSLALGMADVIQAHAGGVQLETLFIDEGFGTLDEVSLEQAIDCLRGLQQNNRVLGIISHVPQLKEEILAKLQVTTSQKGSKIAFTFN